MKSDVIDTDTLPSDVKATDHNFEYVKNMVLDNRQQTLKRDIPYGILDEVDSQTPRTEKVVEEQKANFNSRDLQTRNEQMPDEF